MCSMVRPIGPRLLVQKCYTGEQYAENEKERHIGGILIPEKVADYSVYVEVLGISEDFPPEHEIEIGDTLYLERENGIGIFWIKDSELDEQFIIDEDVILFKVGD